MNVGGQAAESVRGLALSIDLVPAVLAVNEVDLGSVLGTPAQLAIDKRGDGLRGQMVDRHTFAGLLGVLLRVLLRLLLNMLIIALGAVRRTRRRRGHGWHC